MLAKVFSPETLITLGVCATGIVGAWSVNNYRINRNEGAQDKLIDDTLPKLTESWDKKYWAQRKDCDEKLASQKTDFETAVQTLWRRYDEHVKDAEAKRTEIEGKITILQVKDGQTEEQMKAVFSQLTEIKAMLTTLLQRVNTRKEDTP